MNSFAVSTQVRPAFPYDEEGAARLLRTVFPADPHTYERNIRESNCLNVVAETSGGPLIGFASLLIEASPQRGTAEWRKYPLYIGVMAVDALWRSKGIGTELLQLLAAAARQKAPHHQAMHLHVDCDSPAVRFYERFGFSKVSEFKGSYLMRLVFGPR
ncbi:GNAT family N-acetyltransferase [Pyxidicoccus trucidator]|uniref:GNAT family N-acetyltransferase n=1 Tax=Pyxidicoccus trucidator TaxID=2709662 RepID=UPI0013DB6E1F|nr:GNAT family N-acetyltransferase [Pyxidicoccus trucidator]